MKQENYDFLTSKILPKLGFDGVFDKSLETKMKLGLPTFELKASQTRDNEKTQFILGFDQKGEMYYLNRIKGTLTNGQGETFQTTFLLYNQQGHHVDQMNRLLDGKSVKITYYNKDSQKKHKWETLDRTQLNKQGNYPIISTAAFDVVKELSKIKGWRAAPDEKEDLARRMEQGERVPISVWKNNIKETLFLEAAPIDQAIKIFDSITSTQAIQLTSKVEKIQNLKEVIEENIAVSQNSSIGNLQTNGISQQNSNGISTDNSAMSHAANTMREASENKNTHRHGKGQRA